jgi:hypothetical protein
LPPTVASIKHLHRTKWWRGVSGQLVRKSHLVLVEEEAAHESVRT